jgi:hypothetical protein
MDTDATLSDLDPSDLRAAVRHALGRDGADVVDWRAQSIYVAVNQMTAGLFRISGTARDRGESLPWSLVVKIVRNAVDFNGVRQEDPSQSNYWKREPLLYRSRLLERLPPGLAAPRCYGVTEPRPETAWIWIEDVVDVEGRWTIDRYGSVSRHLGAFNGAYLTGRPLPADECLTRDWLRGAVGDTTAMMQRLSELREHPLLRQHGWSDELLDRQARLAAQQDYFLGALESLPRTFCHLDAFRGNLLTRISPDGQEETVAVDWSFSGYGVVGQDLYAMAVAPVFFNDADPERLDEVDAVAFEGYLAGLRDAGWFGDPGLARLGYAVAAALRWGTVPYWLMAIDDHLAAVLERASGHSLEENLERTARVTRFVLDLGDEARERVDAMAGR